MSASGSGKGAPHTSKAQQQAAARMDRGQAASGRATATAVGIRPAGGSGSRQGPGSIGDRVSDSSWEGKDWMEEWEE